MPGASLFSGSFASSVAPNGSFMGLSGLNWTVAAGSYWVTYTSSAPTNRETMRGSAPNPLLDEAFSTFGAPFQPFDTLNLGVQIFGDTASTGVPEPATWAMLMLGFGGLGYAMRRRSQVSTRIVFA